MQFVAVQFDIVWEDKTANHTIIEQMLHQFGIRAGAFVVLPELGDTGFSFNLPAIVDERTLLWGRELAARLKIWLQVGHAELDEDGKGRNSATIISPEGDPVGTYHKVHPFSFGRESEHFTGGDLLTVCDCDGIRVCPLICYDLRFPELWRHGALAGADVFTIGASWPELRQEHWRNLLPARAIENQAYVVAVNRIGSDPNHSYAGGSMVLSPQGRIIADSGNDAGIITSEVKAEVARDWRAEFPALRDIRGELLGAIRVQRTI